MQIDIRWSVVGGRYGRGEEAERPTEAGTAADRGRGDMHAMQFQLS